MIEAKKPYFDICDDWRPTLELLELSDKAKKAGITAIIGIGASPGLTNLMAVLAYNELDEVDEIITGWGIGKFKHNKKPRYYVTGKRLKEKLGHPPPRPSSQTEPGWSRGEMLQAPRDPAEREQARSPDWQGPGR